MATLSDIRAHISSIQQTRKITNAMYLISSSRMRKAMANIEHNRAYFYRAWDTMKEIRAHANIDHPYLVHRDKNKTAYIVIASERGLSGSYNHDILKFAEESISKRNVSNIFTVGDYAAHYFKTIGLNVDENFVHIGQKPSINTARRLTNIIMDLYDNGQIDELRIVYTMFKNTVHQVLVDIEVLPIELDILGPQSKQQRGYSDDILYEPSAYEVFHELVPQFIIGYIYGSLVHAYASENVARMTAMEGATKSADEMIAKLTHEYHMARQLAVTNELAEIVGAANAFGNESKQ